MKKRVIGFSAYFCAFSLLLSPAAALNVSAVEASDLDGAVELVSVVTGDEEEELEIEDITDEELLEAEPSELPAADEDPALAKRLAGRMLLDVEGNGEVYYLDPVTGGKEYLADGESAQLLLRRRALGINETDFAKLTLGTAKEDASVCADSGLGNRLKGRIVLRTEKNGEAYWIYPVNCRAYYAGTFEASYELMKKFSLGVTKKDLAKVRNNHRQRMKNMLRLSVYANAEDKDLSLKEAREDLKEEVQAIKNCMENFRASSTGEKVSSEQNKERVRTCVQNSEMPKISKERRMELKETIREARQERNSGIINGIKKKLGEIDFKKILERAKEMIKNKKANNSQK